VDWVTHPKKRRLQQRHPTGRGKSPASLPELHRPPPSLPCRASSQRRRPPFPPAATSPPPLSPPFLSSRRCRFNSGGAHVEPEPAFFAVRRRAKFRPPPFFSTTGEPLHEIISISSISGAAPSKWEGAAAGGARVGGRGRRRVESSPNSDSTTERSIQRWSDRFGSCSGEEPWRRGGTMSDRAPPLLRLRLLLLPFRSQARRWRVARTWRGRVARGGRRGMSREERGDLVLPSRSRARQNASPVCVFCWRLFLRRKNTMRDPK
jgi:hypothetical protein